MKLYKDRTPLDKLKREKQALAAKVNAIEESIFALQESPEQHKLPPQEDMLNPVAEREKEITQYMEKQSDKKKKQPVPKATQLNKIVLLLLLFHYKDSDVINIIGS